MYYIVKLPSKHEHIKIFRSFNKTPHKMDALYNYLDKKNIKYLEKKEDIKEAGKFCVPGEIQDTYKVYNMYKDNDGYIFNGALYEKSYHELFIIERLIDINKKFEEYVIIPD